MFIFLIKNILVILDGCLCCCEAGDGNAEGAAGDIVEANLMAERDG